MIAWSRKDCLWMDRRQVNNYGHMIRNEEKDDEHVESM